MKMKKVLALALAMSMSMTMFGCGSSESKTETAKSEATEAASAEATEEAADPTAEVDEYESMTDEELYELAKAEGGEINIYATSSKMLKNEEAFEEAFPGLDVVITDLDNDEVIEKIQIESETGNITGDVMQCKDAAGSIYYDFESLGYVEEFYPADITEKIDDRGILEYGYPLYASQSFWFYNTEAFPDGAPVSNWWEIIEKNEDGSQKFRLFTKEIGQEEAYLSLFASFILNADQMEAAYKDLYGTDLEYTYDASAFNFEVPENNAGVEFLYRFTQLSMTFIGDGDELVLAVHNSTADDPALALASAGKITNRDESNYNIGWCTNLAPYTGLKNIEYMYVVSGCDNPAGARLFIRFATGGADGESGGLKPFMKEGNWPVRNDVVNDKNPVEDLADTGAIAPDLEGIYNMYYDVQDMWTYWLDQNPNM